MHYATQGENLELVPSPLLVGKVDPKRKGFPKGLKDRSKKGSPKKNNPRKSAKEQGDFEVPTRTVVGLPFRRRSPIGTLKNLVALQTTRLELFHPKRT
jgi:hypothetical protein